MNGGDTPEDRVVQIEDLPDADSSSHVRLAILFPAWLTSPQSPRQRRQRLAAFIALGCMALLIILGSTPAVRNLVARGTALPTPTPTLPPEDSEFYVQAIPAWGHLVIDGRLLSSAPAPRVAPPLHLSPGHHTLQWRAAPFLTQSCTLSVPPHYASDTCVDNNVIELAGGHYVSIISFEVSLDDLPTLQRIALINVVQAALNSAQSRTMVRPGERYALPPSCSSSQPLTGQLSGCFGVAHQPLRATLHFQLDTNAVTNASCASPEPQQPCSISTQNCHLFCSGFSSSAWNVVVPVRDLFTFTLLDGYIVKQDVPDNLNQESLVPLQITWDQAGWHVSLQLGSAQSFFGFPTCEPMAMNTNLLGDPQISTPSLSLASLQFSYAVGQSLADGCVAVATYNPLSGSTPTSSTAQAQIAALLYRFGIILAANSAAHRYWPYLPVADSYEQQLAAQAAKTAQSI